MEALRWAYPYRLGRDTREPGAHVDIDIDDEQIGQGWRLVSNGTSWAFDSMGPLASVALSGDQTWGLLTNNYDQPRMAPCTQLVIPRSSRHSH